MYYVYILFQKKTKNYILAFLPI